MKTKKELKKLQEMYEVKSMDELIKKLIIQAKKEYINGFTKDFKSRLEEKGLTLEDIVKSGEKIREEIKNVKELDIAIADLSYIFKPDLSVIDASYALEGMGPSSGNVVKMDTIIASTNYLAADIIALGITRPDWPLYEVPHLKLISELISSLNFRF